MNFGTNIVLVTGALGWLGISLIKALINGLADCEALSQPQINLQIRCLILPTQDGSVLKKLSKRLEIVTGDLRNPQDCDCFCQGAEGAILFHTAGIIHPQRVAEFYQVILSSEGSCSFRNE